MPHSRARGEMAEKLKSISIHTICWLKDSAGMWIFTQKAVKRKMWAFVIVETLNDVST